jgi:hypothetical protein
MSTCAPNRSGWREPNTSEHPCETCWHKEMTTILGNAGEHQMTTRVENPGFWVRK